MQSVANYPAFFLYSTSWKCPKFGIPTINYRISRDIHVYFFEYTNTDIKFHYHFKTMQADICHWYGESIVGVSVSIIRVLKVGGAFGLAG
jgi:hypothetical protein